jgi:hypothetical protein
MSNEKPSAWARFKAAFTTYEQEAQAPNVTPGAVTQAALEPSAGARRRKPNASRPRTRNSRRNRNSATKRKPNSTPRTRPSSRPSAPRASKLRLRLSRRSARKLARKRPRPSCRAIGLQSSVTMRSESGNSSRSPRRSSFRVPKRAFRPAGPSADDIAERAKGMSDEEIVPQAVRTLKAAGITPKSHDWSAKLGAEILKIKGGESHVA